MSSSPPPPECQAEVTPSPGGGSGSFSYSLEEEHPKAALAVMNQLRLDRQLCDVTLRVRYRRDVPPRDFPAHKVVLAATSPVFKAMFTAGLREGGMEVVPIEGVHPRVMERLLEFAYTASIAVGERCVLPVMNGAVMYQMDSVVRACSHFLVQQLHPSNAIGIAHFAEEIGCLELQQKAREYIYMHFAEVSGGALEGTRGPPGAVGLEEPSSKGMGVLELQQKVRENIYVLFMEGLRGTHGPPGAVGLEEPSSKGMEVLELQQKVRESIYVLFMEGLRGTHGPPGAVGLEEPSSKGMGVLEQQQKVRKNIYVLYMEGLGGAWGSSGAVGLEEPPSKGMEVLELQQKVRENIYMLFMEVRCGREGVWGGHMDPQGLLVLRNLPPRGWRSWSSSRR
uniref:BTB domain-containing protein n=1 Tax=Calidris pygmaea TaxID=425635 RepID=A0A8C3JFG6_9CHAR